MDKEIIVGSLFSGYGGLDMAVGRALGATRLVWVSDIEPGPNTVLAYRHPDVPNLGDITAIDPAGLPRVDVVAGGSPCTDVSFAGRRAGMREGTRSGLWSYQADVIAATRPRLAIWENVMGALSGTAASAADAGTRREWGERLVAAGLCACAEPAFDPADGFRQPGGVVPEREDEAYLKWATAHGVEGLDSLTCRECGRLVYERTADGLKAGTGRLGGVKPNIRALGRVLGDLANLGYDAVWRLLEAAEVGAPHRRARLFVIAWPSDHAMTPVCPPWGEWDKEADLWRLAQTDLFDLAAPFLGAWPKSGAMVGGNVSALPSGWLDMPADRMDDLMYTPRASECDGGGRASGRSVDRSGFLRTQVRLLDLPGHLPTPVARDGGGGGSLSPERKRAGGHAVTLQDVVEKGDLMPTPNTMDTLPARRGEALERILHRGDMNGSRRASTGNLREEVAYLLTPTALYDSEKTGTPANSRRRAARGEQLGLGDLTNLMGEW